MRIVIVGAGLVGSSLAERLLAEGHDISLIEVNSQLCQEIEEHLDLLVVNGSGANPRTLESAGIADADILLAVTPEDEINLISCAIAMQYGVEERIARVRNSDYLSTTDAFDLNKLGVTRSIDPEEAVAQAICQFVDTPGSIEATSFEDDRFLLREFKVQKSMPITGKNLMQIRAMAEHSHVLIMTIVREDKAIIPSGDIVIQENDDVLVLFPKSNLRDFLNLLKIGSVEVRKVIMTGDSLISLKLARALKSRVSKLIWICPDYNFGQQAANALDNIEILHADPNDLDFLREIHAGNADFFIGACKNTENNILSSLLAKSLGAKELISISDQPPKSNRLFRSIGIDHVINPQLTTASYIMNLIHKGHFISSVRIKDMDLEAIRIHAAEGSPIVGIPLKDSWKPLSNKAIVGAIVRGNDFLIPKGDSIFQANDQALIITRSKTIDTIKKLFKGR